MAVGKIQQIYFNLTPWVPTQQYVGKSGSAVSGSFEIGRSTWTEQWMCNFDDLQMLIENILGYATVNGPNASDGVLERNLPAFSATFPYMRATSISQIEAMAPTGQGDFQEAKFKRWKITIQFETLPYDVETDADVLSISTSNTDFPPESLRFVVWNRQPASEFARTPYNAFRYPLPVTPVVPLPGTNGQAILLTKYRITGTWMQVPTDWISNDGGYTFKNLDAATGTVNAKEFMGYPAGTMLFESYEPTPRVMPVLPTSIGVNDPFYIPRCYDVQLKWLYFDPKPYYKPGGVDDASTPRGHNLVFNPKGPVDGYWQRALLIKQTLDKNGNWLYQESDHTKIFKSV